MSNYEVERAARKLDAAAAAVTGAPSDAAADAAWGRYQRAKSDYDSAVANADGERRQRISVNEPDLYRDRGPHQFIGDLFAGQVLRDPLANERLTRHQAYEVEKRALTTSTFGGLIPPEYLLDMYAKALRNGRVFADQVNHQELPETGMSIIIPRITTGLAAGVQSSENSAVSTQDIVESDLTVPVVTIGGYSPVSRQSLERGAYNQGLLVEDLIARYNAALDVECINGSGSSPHMQGFIGTSGIKSSAVSGSSNLPACYAAIADVVQQINSATGGLGYLADTIVMHPRRWGAFVAAVDNSNRPILGISGLPAFNVDGVGNSAGYGYVGTIQGLSVFVDANIPTNLGSGSNEDVVLVFASDVVHLWEDSQRRPMTFAFEQTNGTALQIDLVAAGYAAFSAGRYPGACGKVTGLVPPTFGS